MRAPASDPFYPVLPISPVEPQGRDFAGCLNNHTHTSGNHSYPPHHTKAHRTALLPAASHTETLRRIAHKLTAIQCYPPHLTPKLFATHCVHCVTSSTVRYWYASWWGAPVSTLHRTLWGSLAEILNSPHMDFQGSNPHDERPLKLSTDEPPQLGQPPRTCYPLVVILARDTKDIADLRPDDTVALITVVHIRDEQCPLPSGILAQYLKQANGHLSCLKQLYVTGESGEPEGYTGDPSVDALCCVCTAAPLSRALLPCRHACLCAHCLPKLDKCPICRSAISSYFCIRNDEEPLSNELKQPRFPNSRRIFNLFHYQ
ncbi:zinc finger, c3HC4 type (RING finger) domain-containing protein [Phthorimaea operculella]|nr:zinc finger, c3HC4 type (RING finger) domain-containing protein [Phthorimaea operculella]